MNMIPIDLTGWLYLSRVVVGVFILFIFSKLWREQQQFPILLACLVLMIFFQTIVDASSLYTRLMGFINPDIAYYYMVHSFWWPARLIPGFVVLIIILIRVYCIAYDAKIIYNQRREQ